MGAARRLAYEHPAPSPRPELRLLTAALASRRSPKSRTTASPTALAVFRACCAVMVAIAILGLARISLSVRATEAAIDSQRLASSIKAEALKARSLEADKSALEAPSRIAAIAGCTLQMTETGQVSYICLPESGEQALRTTVQKPETAAVAAGQGAPAGGTAAVVGSFIASVLDIAAGEAQVLLVGDVGLASTR